MTLTFWLLAFAAIAAPEPESRLTSSRTLAPLVIACSACCCCVALSPSAFWISALMPASSNAFLRNGRSTVSQRTDDLESGSRTATLPALLPLSELPEAPESLLLLSSPPQPANTSAPVAAITAAISHARFRMEFPPPDGCLGYFNWPPPRGAWERHGRPRSPRGRSHPGPGPGHRARRR